LRERGVETTIGTYHMPLTTYFRDRGGHNPGDFPVTDDVAARALTLPLHGRLDAAQQQYVADALLSLV
jgi:dTDP-4-amino-4,6-dideoxygalactose transaminase